MAQHDNADGADGDTKAQQGAGGALEREDAAPPAETTAFPACTCAHCGRTRTRHPYQGAQWCGTCISREERRVNTRERYGRGRRGY